MAITKAVVPVAGLGTRLLPATKSQPKEMLPVGRKPVVQYVIEELERAGIQSILFITGRSKTAIENHFDRDQELRDSLKAAGKEDLLDELEYEDKKVEFFYTRQSEQKGLGHAISLAEGYTHDEPFVIALGDSIIESDGDEPAVQRLIAAFEKTKAAAAIAFEEVPREEVFRYGIAKPLAEDAEKEIFRVEDLVEKPSIALATGMRLSADVR